MRRGSAPLTMQCATRWASVLVLPEPAPAITRRGMADAHALSRTPCSTARRCSELSFSRLAAGMDSESVYGQVVQSTMSPVWRTTHSPQPLSEPPSSSLVPPRHRLAQLTLSPERTKRERTIFRQAAQGHVCVSYPPHSQATSGAHLAPRGGSRVSSDRVAVRH